MRYAHLFWDLFGVPATAWDDLPYGDFEWMKAVADEQVKREREAARG